MNLLTPPTHPTPLCRLIWRQNKLWVLPAETSKQHLALPALAQPEWFRACLERSKAKAVVIDPSLGSEVVKFWAEACHKVQKPLYLRLPTMRLLPDKQKVWAWRLKCMVERTLGFGLLVLLSPVMILFALVLNWQDGGPALTYYWCIGKRGQVFRMAQFRRESLDSCQKTSAGKFLEMTRLDRLPRLLNVVRGEMALVGTKPWTIEDALNLPEEYRCYLKALPGVMGPRSLGLNISVVDAQIISQVELSYLKSWSLFKDSQIGIAAMIRATTGNQKLM